MNNESVLNILSSPVVRASLILKHETSARWAEVNPILFKGELGIETDTNLLKIGDGYTQYNNLPYINIPIDMLANLMKDNMPMGSDDQIGGVRGSNSDNSVSIDEDGIMTVNKLSISKLFVEDGSEFIISGGTSASVE